MPKLVATQPSSGGPSRKAMKDVCASAATFTAAGRSVAWAAADIASGKIALLPTPISAKPISASAGCGASSTRLAPMPSKVCRLRATRTGPWRATKPSATQRAPAWASAPTATAAPAAKGGAANTSRM